MKKVLFLIHDLGGGGAEKILVNLVNQLDKKKYEVTVIILFGGGENEKYLQSNIRKCIVWKKTIPGNSKWMKVMTPEQLHRVCVKDSYDIEISFLEGPSARVVSGCPNNGTRRIAWIHTQGITDKNIANSFRNKKEALKCYQSFDKVICVSKTVEQNFRDVIGGSVKVSTIYNVIDSNYILKKSKEPIERGIFVEDEINIIGVGKITSNKGFDRLARIHKRMREDGYPVHVYILGSGPEKVKIQKYLEENKLTSSFTFLGYQSNPYCYLGKADLYVCSSYIEGFSTAAMESLIVGTPVCTVNVSGMREMLGNNEWGVITENTEDGLYKGIKMLISDRCLLSKYAHRAEKRGKDFRTEKLIRAVEELLDCI